MKISRTVPIKNGEVMRLSNTELKIIETIKIKKLHYMWGNILHASFDHTRKDPVKEKHSKGVNLMAA